MAPRFLFWHSTIRASSVAWSPLKTNEVDAPGVRRRDFSCCSMVVGGLPGGRSDSTAVLPPAPLSSSSPSIASPSELYSALTTEPIASFDSSPSASSALCIIVSMVSSMRDICSARSARFFPCSARPAVARSSVAIWRSVSLDRRVISLRPYARNVAATAASTSEMLRCWMIRRPAGSLCR